MCECASKKIVVFDSRDRAKSTDSATDFLVHLKKPLKHCKEVELKEVILPWTMYNISASKANHQLSFKEFGLDAATITIADGQYGVVSLCSAIETAMDTASLASQTFTVTYNTNTMKVGITASTVAFILYGSDSIQTTGLEQELGFLLETTSNLANTSDNVPKILSPEYVLLSIDFIADNVNTLDPNKNASFVLSSNLNASSDVGGTVLHLTAESTFKQVIKHLDVNLQHFRISLRDEQNVLLDLNGCDWSLILAFSF